MSEPFWSRHDLHVVAIALVILALGGVFHDAGGDARKTVSRERVAVQVPSDWLATPATDATVVRGEDAVTRLEIRVAEPPGPLVGLEAALELERAQRHGPLYTRAGSGEARGWLRTVFSYAFKPTPTHAARVATGVEYARVDGGRLFVITLHAPEERVAALEADILSTLVLR
jgi:hypothetical protein